MKDLKKIVARVLNMDERNINDKTSPKNVETWDSFNHIMLISEIESNYNIKLSMDDIQKITCFRDIKNILKSKKRE